MKLPDRVSVNGQWWKVTRRSNLNEKGKPLAGKVLYNKRRIIIRWGMPDIDVLSTLLHEIVHAAVPDLDEIAVGRIEDAVVWALQRVSPS